MVKRSLYTTRIADRCSIRGKHPPALDLGMFPGVKCAWGTPPARLRLSARLCTQGLPVSCTTATSGRAGPKTPHPRVRGKSFPQQIRH